MTIKRLMIGFSIVAAFILGVVYGNSNGSPHKWVRASEPPLPTIQVGGQTITVLSIHGAAEDCSLVLGTVKV